MYNGLILIFLLTFVKDKKNENINLIRDGSKIIDLDIPYTMEKIQILKKIGPYFPEEILPSINKALMITEKLISLHQTMEFLQTSETNYIQETIPVENNQERLSYIAQTIKKEFPKEEIDKTGTVVEMILTMDKFNKLFLILNSIMTNPDSLKDPSNIINLMEPLMDDKDEKEKKKIKDMTKMLEIMKTLDTPKKSTEKENNT
ncbi:hypothetical protein [Schnuerera sp.]|uniref:hypothetical protein n=1 Tax=Schnuerera sp. TaxID=2794844 RepID=UPI002D02D441|nr:hypothetical protein [Schnuerera sp.]HSH36417.1 hypothetical protein [Schnuerera sp.]